MMAWSMNVLAVAIGGSLGDLCRDGLTALFAQGPLHRSIVGISHLVGGEAGFATTLANLLGSLTTFSTLIGDVTVLGTDGRTAASLTLLSVNLVGGVGLFSLAAVSVRGVLS